MIAYSCNISLTIILLSMFCSPEDARRIDLMSTFPDLLGRVYTFAKKKGWHSRPSLEIMFQEEDDITSGRTMDMLNLEDQATGFSVPVIP